jgi:hypothetical protein
MEYYTQTLSPNMNGHAIHRLLHQYCIGTLYTGRDIIHEGAYSKHTTFINNILGKVLQINNYLISCI